MTPTTYNIKFVNIDLVSKSVTVPNPPKSEGENIDFYFNFKVELKVAAPRKLAMTITDVFIKEQSNHNQLAAFKAVCVFELPDFDNLFTKIDEHKYDSPEDLEILLKAAGLSTIRGIIFSEVRGTYLHTAVMPLIDIATMVKEDRKKAKEKVNQ